MTSNEGMLVVVSGPAGVGKGTICKALMKNWTGLEYSVSVTSRSCRPGETEGKEYYFRTREEFAQMVADGEFLEWAEFCGNLYGTPRFHVENVLRAGKTIILEIDIQGGKQVKREFPEAVFIFITPPSMETLSERLHGRGTETEEVILRRLEAAAGELQNMKDYDYAVENDDIGTAVKKIKCIITAERCRIHKRNLFKEEAE